MSYHVQRDVQILSCTKSAEVMYVLHLPAQRYSAEVTLCTDNNNI